MQELAATYCNEADIPTVDAIRRHQELDQHISDARTQLEAAGKISKGVFRSHRNIEAKDGLLWKGTRIIVPTSLQGGLIQEYHGQHHPGAENTCLLIKTRFYWRPPVEGYGEAD